MKMSTTPLNMTNRDRHTSSWPTSEDQQEGSYDATDDTSETFSENTLAGSLITYNINSRQLVLSSENTLQSEETTVTINALNQFVFQAGNIYKGKKLTRKEEEELREAAKHVGLSMEVVDAFLKQTADPNAVVKYIMASDNAFARKVREDPQLSRLLGQGESYVNEGSFDLVNSVWRVLMHKIVQQFLKDHNMQPEDIMNKSSLTSQLDKEAEGDGQYAEFMPNPSELAKIRRDYTQERKELSIPLDEAKEARRAAEAMMFFEPHRPFHHILHNNERLLIVGGESMFHTEARDDELSLRPGAYEINDWLEMRHTPSPSNGKTIYTSSGERVAKRRSGRTFTSPETKPHLDEIHDRLETKEAKYQSSRQTISQPRTEIRKFGTNLTPLAAQTHFDRMDDRLETKEVSSQSNYETISTPCGKIVAVRRSETNFASPEAENNFKNSASNLTCGKNPGGMSAVKRALSIFEKGDLEEDNSAPKHQRRISENIERSMNLESARALFEGGLKNNQDSTINGDAGCREGNGENGLHEPAVTRRAHMTLSKLLEVFEKKESSNESMKIRTPSKASKGDDGQGFRHENSNSKVAQAFAQFEKGTTKSSPSTSQKQKANVQATRKAKKIVTPSKSNNPDSGIINKSNPSQSCVKLEETFVTCENDQDGETQPLVEYNAESTMERGRTMETDYKSLQSSERNAHTFKKPESLEKGVQSKAYSGADHSKEIFSTQHAPEDDGDDFQQYSTDETSSVFVGSTRRLSRPDEVCLEDSNDGVDAVLSSLTQSSGSAEEGVDSQKIRYQRPPSVHDNHRSNSSRHNLPKKKRGSTGRIVTLTLSPGGMSVYKENQETVPWPRTKSPAKNNEVPRMVVKERPALRETFIQEKKNGMSNSRDNQESFQSGENIWKDDGRKQMRQNRPPSGETKGSVIFGKRDERTSSHHDEEPFWSDENTWNEGLPDVSIAKETKDWESSESNQFRKHHGFSRSREERLSTEGDIGLQVYSTNESGIHKTLPNRTSRESFESFHDKDSLTPRRTNAAHFKDQSPYGINAMNNETVQWPGTESYTKENKGPNTQFRRRNNSNAFSTSPSHEYRNSRVTDPQKAKLKRTGAHKGKNGPNQESDLDALNPIGTETTRSMSFESDFDAFNLYDDPENMLFNRRFQIHDQKEASTSNTVRPQMQFVHLSGTGTPNATRKPIEPNDERVSFSKDPRAKSEGRHIHDAKFEALHTFLDEYQYDGKHSQQTTNHGIKPPTPIGLGNRRGFLDGSEPQQTPNGSNKGNLYEKGAKDRGYQEDLTLKKSSSSLSDFLRVETASSASGDSDMIDQNIAVVNHNSNNDDWDHNRTRGAERNNRAHPMSPTALRSKDSETSAGENMILRGANVEKNNSSSFNKKAPVDSDTCRPASARHLNKDVGPLPSREDPENKSIDPCLTVQCGAMSPRQATRDPPSADPLSSKSLTPAGEPNELPEGATEEEIRLLNRFIEVASGNFDGKKLSAQSELRVRSAASKVGLSERFVDQLLEQGQSANKEDGSKVPAFTVGEEGGYQRPESGDDGYTYYTVDLTGARGQSKPDTDNTGGGCAPMWDNFTKSLKAWTTCGDDGSSVSSTPSATWIEDITAENPATSGTPVSRKNLRALV